MGSFFLNPGLVIPGAALIASPIIIHLINRLRFRRVRFAAMEFLLQSQQRNRRRILIEQLILLLLRILIVLAIMFLIARFFLSASQLSLLQGKAASHHVILIDDSGSMRERAGEESVFGRAKVVVRRLVAKGAQEPGTQRVTILLLSKPDKALFREAEVDDNLVKRVETSLQNVDCTRRRLDLVDGIKAAGKTLLDDQESRTAIKMLHVISDFRDEDWKTAQSSLVSTVESLTKAKVSVNLIRTIKQGGANVAVTKLSGDVYTAAVGVEMQVTIGLTNFGRQPKENIAVRLWADGKRLPLAVVFDKLPPGREVQRSADVLFETAGVHKLRAELVPVDSLDSDNTRFLAVEKLPEAHKVLLIDGDPAAKDALYVADALAAEKNIAGIQVETHGPDWLRRNPLDAFQCIYMINVPQVDADAMRPLTQYVRDGGGLVWFLGNLVNSDFYNSKLYQTELKKDEAGNETRRSIGLFPVPLFVTSDELPPKNADSKVADVAIPGRHPIFNELLDIDQGKLLGLLTVKRYWPVSPTLPGAAGGDWDKNDNKRKDGVATIARLRNGRPLMFEHRFGQGRIVTCLTSAGRAWNNWGSTAIYPIIQLEIRKVVSRRTLDRQRLVGQPIDETLPGSVYTDTAMIGSPDTEPTPLRAGRVPAKTSNKKSGKAKKDDDELAYRVIYNETDEPGIYPLKLTRIKGADKVETRMYAYNVPAEESATALVETKTIQAKFPKNKKLKVFDFGSEAAFEGEQPGQEILKFLIALLVVLLLVEQTLAYVFSYHTRDA